MKSLKKSDFFNFTKNSHSKLEKPTADSVHLKGNLYEKAKSKVSASKEKLSKGSPRKNNEETFKKISAQKPTKETVHSLLNDVRYFPFHFINPRQIKFKFTNCNEDSITKKLAAKRNQGKNGKETQSLTIKHIGSILKF